MKRFYLLFIALFVAANVLYAQEEGVETFGDESPYIYDDTESTYTAGTLPDGWSRFTENDDEVADELAWNVVTEDYHDGDEDTKGLKTFQWLSNAHCWLVTKQFTPEGDVLSFYYRDTDWTSSAVTEGRELQVYVSTNAEQPTASTDFEENPIETLEEFGGTGDDWEEAIIDLSDYSGQNIYVGILLKNDGEQDGWFIDHFEGLGAPVSAINDVAAPSFNIYPNPTHSFVKVTNVENAVIKVYNILGKEMAAYHSEKAVKQIDMSQFTEGTYIIQITNEKGVYAKKVNYIR